MEARWFSCCGVCRGPQCRLVSGNQRSLMFASRNRSCPTSSRKCDFGRRASLPLREWCPSLQPVKRNLLSTRALCWLNAGDLRQLQRIERKACLGRFIRSGKCDRLRFATTSKRPTNGSFKKFVPASFAGIVAKRKHSVYKDSGTSWLKIKIRSYPGRRKPRASQSAAQPLAFRIIVPPFRPGFAFLQNHFRLRLL